MTDDTIEINGMKPNEDFFLYTERWRNGLLAFTVRKPNGNGGGRYDGMRVLLLHAYGPYEDWSACPLGTDYAPRLAQRMNPFASSTREFTDFGDGLDWLLLDLNRTAGEQA